MAKFFSDKQLYRLSLFKTAIILCRTSRLLDDKEMIYRAEDFCRQNFGIPCTEIDDIDPDVVKRVELWLGNAQKN